MKKRSDTPYSDSTSYKATQKYKRLRESELSGKMPLSDMSDMPRAKRSASAPKDTDYKKIVREKGTLRQRAKHRE